MSEEFEAILDRRLGDFEKVVAARLNNIQEGVNDMKYSMGIFVDKLSNLHKDYVPRDEVIKDQMRTGETIGKLEIKVDKLEIKVEKLEAWRNYLAGSIAVLAFVITLLASTHFWK